VFDAALAAVALEIFAGHRSRGLVKVRVMRVRRARLSIAIDTMIAASLLVAAPPSSGASSVTLTTCGQSLSGAVVLAGDLDCAGAPDPGVRLGHASTLDLQGFTLSGGNGDGVVCEGRCAVISDEDGGTIAGFAGDGIVARDPTESSAFMRVNHVIVRDNGGYGIRVDEADGGAAVSKSEILGNGGAGIASPGRMRVSNVTVSGNQLEGIRGENVSVLESLVELNGTGIEISGYGKLDSTDVFDNVGDGVHGGPTFRTFRVQVERNGGSGIVLSSVEKNTVIQLAEVSDNGLDGIRVDGPQLHRVRLRFAFVRRNGRHGIVSRHIDLHQSRVDDNAFHGVFGEPGGEPCIARLDRYSLLGNGTDPSCGVAVTCADVAICDPPLAFNESTECDTSYDSSSGFPGTSWSICDAD
jgi:hypothetical protein